MPPPDLDPYLDPPGIRGNRARTPARAVHARAQRNRRPPPARLRDVDGRTALQPRPARQLGAMVEYRRFQTLMLPGTQTIAPLAHDSLVAVRARHLAPPALGAIATALLYSSSRWFRVRGMNVRSAEGVGIPQ